MSGQHLPSKLPPQFSFFRGWQSKLSQAIEKSLVPANSPLGLILTQIALRRTAYGYATKYETLQYIAYGIMLFVAAECVSEEDARRRFAQIMSVFGAIYALFSLVQTLNSNGKIYWIHSQ